MTIYKQFINFIAVDKFYIKYCVKTINNKLNVEDRTDNSFSFSKKCLSVNISPFYLPPPSQVFREPFFIVLQVFGLLRKEIRLA